MDETLKVMHVSMSESKERTAQIRARHEWIKKACSRDKNHEDLKVLGVTPIECLFSCVKPNDDGAGYESTLVEKHPNDSESTYLDDKDMESGVEEIKILGSNETPTLDFKEFNYDSCSLIECISLMQSMLSSPHTYSQNKAFTDHIVDATMKYLEEKLELEVSIPR